MKLTDRQIASWLRIDDPYRLELLWRLADTTRRQHVGDEVHLRGLIEIGNCCDRQCLYCGLRAGATDVRRYRMTVEEIFQCVELIVQYGYGTVVMQSGEDQGLDVPMLRELIRRIKAETPLAVTLSLGELEIDQCRQLRQAGADRFLLRFETSNETLYHRIHPALPGRPLKHRIEILGELREIGFEIGSGVMVGIPGQNYDDLLTDLRLFEQLDLDMIGIGPYIPHPGTPLGSRPELFYAQGDAQVPATETMTHKVLALARLVCPDANIPSTTALATINRESGLELGLQRGANIVMPNVTPTQYREAYQVYPNKARATDRPETTRDRVEQRIVALGRPIGRGRGDSPGLARSKPPRDLPTEE